MLELPEDDLGLRLLRLIVEHQQGHLLSRHSMGLAGLTNENEIVLTLTAPNTLHFD
jgi:hypothetical protein